MPDIVTVDFHVTAECNQECPYCWGPQGFENPVDTATAGAIVHKISTLGARRVVFTGGDPILRPDIGSLIFLAKQLGLEVALSTTGDELTRDFLLENGSAIDLISLPLDGSSEQVSGRTKKPGHFGSIMRDLNMLAEFPAIDVKVATPVTRHNLDDVPAIVRLLEERAVRTPNRMFYNVFQAFPRAMGEVDWSELTVSDAEFEALRNEVGTSTRAFNINWLTHETLDRLYAMVFPDGTLTIPSGPEYLNYGPVLAVDDLHAVLGSSEFDAPKHVRHDRGWSKTGEGVSREQ